VQREKREKAGKYLEIDADIISTREMILLRNTIGRLFLPSEIFPGAGFQSTEFQSVHVGVWAMIIYRSHAAVEQ